VKPQARDIHIFSNKSGIKQSKYLTQSFNKRLLHPLRPIVIIEGGQAFVFYATNHK
jgi:hypothetical protein